MESPNPADLVCVRFFVCRIRHPLKFPPAPGMPTTGQKEEKQYVRVQIEPQRAGGKYKIARKLLKHKKIALRKNVCVFLGRAKGI